MKTIKISKSLLETAYEIAKKQRKPIFIYDLLKQTCKKHQINDFSDYKKINQLYLDITLSGQFIFCDDKCLMIKENNKEHWDKDFFEKPQNNKIDDLSDSLAEQNLDFEDFLLEKLNNEDDKQNKKNNAALEDDSLDNEEDKKNNSDEILDNNDKEDDYDDLLDDYDYLYDK
ncbi:DNA-directed RNA polymerase delta subunit [Candidatus Phytoplasma solani]|uniref:DNA-directed RNA polymerase subunit delta n=1 Tax=Candidatus Phytoplasma solani TaxID=69896 RepID=UPI0032DA66A8